MPSAPAVSPDPDPVAARRALAPDPAPVAGAIEEREAAARIPAQAEGRRIRAAELEEGGQEPVDEPGPATSEGAEPVGIELEPDPPHERRHLVVVRRRGRPAGGVAIARQPADELPDPREARQRVGVRQVVRDGDRVVDEVCPCVARVAQMVVVGTVDEGAGTVMPSRTVPRVGDDEQIVGWRARG